MSVSTIEAGVIRIGDGVTVEFSFAFEAISAATIKVSRIVGSSLVPVTSGVTPALNPGGVGGTVTFDVAPVSLAEYYIYRDTEATQLVNVSKQTRYDPEVVEEVWDKLTFLVQELEADVDRSVKTVPGEDPDLLIESIFEAAAESTANAAAAVAAAASVNLIGVADVAALKALDTTIYKAAIVRSGSSVGIYLWNVGDYTIAHAAEAGTDFFLIKSDAIAIATGAWVRYIIAHDRNDFHRFAAREDGSLNFEIEALESADAYLSAMGGTDPFGPTLSTQGTGANIQGQLAAKGEAGWVFGNALGRLLEVLSGVSGYIADRILKIRPGVASQSTYASIDAEGGLDFKTGGDTLVRLIDGAGAGTAQINIEATSSNVVAISASTGDTLTISGAQGLQLYAVSGLRETWNAPDADITNGETVNLPSFGTGRVLLLPNAGSIAGATLSFPATPGNGDIMRIDCRGVITTVTWASAGGHGISGAPTGLTSLTPVAFQYRTGYGWQRTS